MHYLETSMLGYDTGIVNSAILLDKFEMLNDNDFDFSNLEQIQKDPVFDTLFNSNHFKPPTSIYTFLYDDIEQGLKLFKSNNESKEYLKSLFSPIKNISKEYQREYMLQLYEDGAQKDELFSLLRLGDIYSNSELVDHNYTRSYNYYSRIIKLKSSVQSNDKFIISMAYFYLGYYNHKGMGIEKNLNTAIKYYNSSLLIYDKASLYVHAYMKLAQLERNVEEIIKNNDQNQENQERSIFYVVLKLLGLIEFFRALPAIIIMLLISIIGIYKQRLKNYISIYHSD